MVLPSGVVSTIPFLRQRQYWKPTKVSIAVKLDVEQTGSGIRVGGWNVDSDHFTTSALPRTS